MGALQRGEKQFDEQYFGLSVKTSVAICGPDNKGVIPVPLLIDQCTELEYDWQDV